ncbi:MAG: ribonuclease HII [Anaerolineales bacterium]|nr:ribonuclease HII [Anaerolineales bacterium]
MARAKFDLSSLPQYPSLEIENRLWQSGFVHLAGIDEAGRGALAGPVAAAAVILPNDRSRTLTLNGVRDSKQMTRLQRERFVPRIKATALAWGVGFAAPEEIDGMGILPATQLAATRAVRALSLVPDYLITDYLFLPETDIPQEKFIKGDCRALSIAAASVLAKTARDALLRELDARYPDYGFAQHKGYGTRQHRQAIQKLGRCPVHRKSFTFRAEKGFVRS